MNSKEETLTLETNEPAELATQVKRIQEHLIFLERKIDTLLEMTRKSQERGNRPERRPMRFDNQGHGGHQGSSFKSRRPGGPGGHDRRPEWKGRRDHRENRDNRGNDNRGNDNRGNDNRGNVEHHAGGGMRPKRPFFKPNF